MIYLIRADSEGLLIDTFIAGVDGSLKLNQEARYRRSGLRYFGESYTPVTFEQSLDNLDLKDINDNIFTSPTIRVPISQIDPSKGLVVNISKFGEELLWTFIVPLTPIGEGAERTLRVSKLHYIYDETSTIYSSDDFEHKYPGLHHTTSILNLNTASINDGITFANSPGNVKHDADGNTLPSDQLRPQQHVGDIVSIDGTVYSMEESAATYSTNYETANTASTVSSVSNMLVSVLFSYTDTIEPGSRDNFRGLVFLNGYLDSSGFLFTNGSNFDVNDITESHLPMLEHNARLNHEDISTSNVDIRLPKDFWLLRYDSALGGSDQAGVRSLLLNANDLNSNRLPTQIGVMDTYSSVVSTNIHLLNNVTGGIFMNKKAERSVIKVTHFEDEKNPRSRFYLISRDHYNILGGSTLTLTPTTGENSLNLHLKIIKGTTVLEDVILDSIKIDDATINLIELAASINKSSKFVYAIIDKDAPKLKTSKLSEPLTFNINNVEALTFETGGYNAYVKSVGENNVMNFNGSYTTPISSTEEGAITSLVTTRGDFTTQFWHSTPLGDFPANHIFTMNSPNNSLISNIDINFQSADYITVTLNNTVLSTRTQFPLLIDNWRHIALTYTQPYTIQFNGGGGFEVKKATNYNFQQNFGLVTTFKVNDLLQSHGLIYKGTGSLTNPPEIKVSYMLYIETGINDTAEVTLVFTDGTNTRQQFTSKNLKILAGQYYQLVVSKAAVANEKSGPGSKSSPYTLPFDIKDLSNSSGGAEFDPSKISSGKLSGFKNVSTDNKLDTFNNNLSDNTQQSYNVNFELRPINDDGTFGDLIIDSQNKVTDPNNSKSLMILNTGNSHLLFGEIFDQNNNLSSLRGAMRRIAIFSNAIDSNKFNSSTTAELLNSGLVGYWTAAYDRNNVVNNLVDSTKYAISTNSEEAFLLALREHEFEGAAVYVNGTLVSLFVDKKLSLPKPSTTSIKWEASKDYKLSEITFWSEARQQYQVQSDMFGRLATEILPNLKVYLSGVVTEESLGLTRTLTTPYLLSKFIRDIRVIDEAGGLQAVSTANIDLAGCPMTGRCGPLITPNLYTPSEAALTIADTPPDMTTYSITVTRPDGIMVGEIEEVYVYLKDSTINLFTGHKVGDLLLQWVSQEQGDVQLMGYIEGPPPVPMANLTAKDDYSGATSLAFKAPTSISYKYTTGSDLGSNSKFAFSDGFGVKIGLKTMIAPLGFGLSADVLSLDLGTTVKYEKENEDSDGSEKVSNNKLDVVDSYKVSLTGSLPPISRESGTGVDERFGSRFFVPSPYGTAYVKSKTLDVYEQRLLQSNTIYGYVKVPNKDIPEDFNIVSFKFSNKYIRPGCLDGIITYEYTEGKNNGPSGQMQPLYDSNFPGARTGHDASYKRIIETYNLKKQIDLEAHDQLARYNSVYNAKFTTHDGLTEPINFYNEYVWHCRGGFQEVNHSFSNSFEETYSTSSSSKDTVGGAFNLKLSATAVTVADLNISYESGSKLSTKFEYKSTMESSFNFETNVDGVERNTQMKRRASNDIEFMNTVNKSNSSGFNLIAGSDGLLYKTSSSGQNETDDTSDLFGINNLPAQPYDRPGAIKLYRWYSFFMQPNIDNSNEFWDTVVDPQWLQNSRDTDANALRTAKGKPSIPWRLFHRVTYSERFLPPIGDIPRETPESMLYVALPLKAIPVNMIPGPSTLLSTLPEVIANPNNIGKGVLAAVRNKDTSSTYVISKDGTHYTLIPNTVPNYTAFEISTTLVDAEIVGYAIVKYTLQQPHPNTKYEVAADLSVYKLMSLFDMFPKGDVAMVKATLITKYPSATFNVIADTDIQSVFAANIVAFFDVQQKAT
jgi:hypothetical protein